MIGFLFGFYKFGGPRLPASWHRYEDPIRLESQVAGVATSLQGGGIGTLLKKAQARQALEQGVRVINWTVDPLQFHNASLNFRKLRAVAFHFLPDHYSSFRNELNRTRASRLEITWLPAPDAQEAQELTLEEERDLSFVNRGRRAIQLDEQAPRIAIEIPPNWKALQDADFQAALAWRDATDEILQAYLGHEDGRYMITDTGKKNGRCYLVARRIGGDFPPPEPEL